MEGDLHSVLQLRAGCLIIRVQAQSISLGGGGEEGEGEEGRRGEEEEEGRRGGGG